MEKIRVARTRNKVISYEFVRETLTENSGYQEIFWSWAAVRLFKQKGATAAARRYLMEAGFAIVVLPDYFSGYPAQYSLFDYLEQEVIVIAPVVEID